MILSSRKYQGHQEYLNLRKLIFLNKHYNIFVELNNNCTCTCYDYHVSYTQGFSLFVPRPPNPKPQDHIIYINIRAPPNFTRLPTALDLY